MRQWSVVPSQLVQQQPVLHLHRLPRFGLQEHFVEGGYF
jgi:hypothetical protein